MEAFMALAILNPMALSSYPSVVGHSYTLSAVITYVEKVERYSKGLRILTCTAAR